jgi:NAD+ synthase
MGMTYEQLDNYILTGEGNDEVKCKVDMMNQRSEHKRVPVPKFVPSEKQ